MTDTEAPEPEAIEATEDEAEGVGADELEAEGDEEEPGTVGPNGDPDTPADLDADPE